MTVARPQRWLMTLSQTVLHRPTIGGVMAVPYSKPGRSAFG